MSLLLYSGGHTNHPVAQCEGDSTRRQGSLGAVVEAGYLSLQGELSLPKPHPHGRGEKGCMKLQFGNTKAHSWKVPLSPKAKASQNCLSSTVLQHPAIGRPGRTPQAPSKSSVFISLFYQHPPSEDPQEKFPSGLTVRESWASPE